MVVIRMARRGSGFRRELSFDDLFISSKGQSEDPRLLGVFRDLPKGILEIFERRTGASKENGWLAVQRVRKGVKEGPLSSVVIVHEEDRVVFCNKDEGDVFFAYFCFFTNKVRGCAENVLEVAFLEAELTHLENGEQSRSSSDVRVESDVVPCPKVIDRVDEFFLHMGAFFLEETAGQVKGNVCRCVGLGEAEGRFNHGVLGPFFSGHLR